MNSLYLLDRSRANTEDVGPSKPFLHGPVQWCGDPSRRPHRIHAMHVAAVDPTPVATDRDGVPAELVESERKILRTQALDSGKPENIVEKIVDGRINKFYAENCLLEQPFVKDPDTTVAKVLAASDAALTVSSFVRFKLGEASES